MVVLMETHLCSAAVREELVGSVCLGHLGMHEGVHACPYDPDMKVLELSRSLPIGLGKDATEPIGVMHRGYEEDHRWLLLPAATRNHFNCL